MIRNRKYERGNKVISLILFSFFIILFSVNAQSALAADSSQSADIQSKLSQLEQEIASKAAQIKDQVSQKLQNKVYAGIIQSLSDTQYTLSSLNGEPRVVTINDFTKDIFQGKKIGQKISKGDFVIALGDQDDKNNLVAKQIIKTASPSATQTDYVWGKILSKTSSSIIVLNKDNKQIVITFSGNTNFKLNTDDASIDDAKVNNFLVGVGVLSKDGSSLKARLVYLIPYQGFIKTTKEATKSATPTAKKK